MTRRPLELLFALGLIVAAVAVTSQVHRVRAAAADVAVSGVTFTDTASNSPTTTITAGDTVLWTWAGDTIHSVTADDASFDEPPGSSKMTGTFSRTFGTPGTYVYYCRIHGAPGGIGMSGTIVVNAAVPTNTPTRTPTPEPSATRRPDTPTSTAEPAASGTATPVATEPPATVVAMPVGTAPSIAASPVRAVAGVEALPSTGTGEVQQHALPWTVAALAVCGAGLLAGATLRRFR